MIRLTARARAQLVEFLREDVEANVFLLSVIARGVVTKSPELAEDGAFFATPDLRRIQGVAYVTRGGLGVVYAPDDGDAFALGDHLRRKLTPRMIVGQRRTADAFWRGLNPPFEARIRRAHQLYTLRPGELQVPVEPGVSIAKSADLAAVYDLSARMQTEELGVDPRTVDDKRFRIRIGRLVDAGLVYMLKTPAGIAFHASASAICPDGTQVEAVFTPPHLRGSGYASLGMAGMCEDLFARYPLITLHVNENNQPAVKLYEKLGFTAAAPFRLISC